MKETKTETTYTCDKCRNKITDVAYVLFCHAEQVNGDLPSVEVASYNLNAHCRMLFVGEQKHLCRKCKDAITDGVFIV